MKEKPILFSGDMVRAVLDGRKTQTRRVMQFHPERWQASADYCGQDIDQFTPQPCGGWQGFGYVTAQPGCLGPCCPPFLCPYGAPGDLLWVRETHAIITGAGDTPQVIYRASCPLGPYGSHMVGESEYHGPWKPSIFMRREYARITLQIVNVRVERVQDISEADAITEGIVKQPHGYGLAGLHMTLQTAREAFGCLWDTINGNRKDSKGNRLPYAWADNPWVWVVEFARIGGAS